MPAGTMCRRNDEQGGKDAVVTGEVHARARHERGEPGVEFLGREDDVGGAVAEGLLQFKDDPAVVVD